MNLINVKIVIGKPLTWDELANIYDERTGGRSRTLPMDAVFDWGCNQPDLLYVEEDGTLHRWSTKPV